MDGVDNNCDGTIDNPSILTHRLFIDLDGDGYGSTTSSVNACSQPSGYVANDTDCDDSSAGSNPIATEICDGEDNNCDEPLMIPTLTMSITTSTTMVMGLETSTAMPVPSLVAMWPDLMIVMMMQRFSLRPRFVMG